MEPSVVAALVGATGGIAAAWGAAWWTYRTRHRPEQYERVATDRSRAIAGVWKGKGADTTKGGKKAEAFEVVWELRVDGTDVVGTSKMNYPGEASATFDLKGGFLHTDYCRLLYTVTPTHGTVRFGAVVVRLSMELKSLKGLYMGYSSREPEGVVTGWVNLTKEG